MPYVPKWQRLSDALARLVTTGVTEEQAKLDLCHAIADKKIKIRFLITSVWAEGRRGGKIGMYEEAVDSSNVNIPPHLCLEDFDWQKSIPVGVRDWRKLAPDGSLHFEIVTGMEVFRSDVEKVLCRDHEQAAEIKKPQRGRPATYNWIGVKERLADYVAKHGPVQTSGELLQNCADFASELHPGGSTPDDKTIREAIKTHALDIAAGVAPGN
jgi:hypothetical protein